MATRPRRSRVRVGAACSPGLAIGVNFVPRVVTALGGSERRRPHRGRAVVLVPRRLDRSGVRPRHRAPGPPGVPDLPTRSRSGTAIAGAAVGSLRAAGPDLARHPSLATAQGWPARMARDSFMVAADPAPSRPASRRASRHGASPSPKLPTRRPSVRSTDPPDPGVRAPTTVSTRRRRRAGTAGRSSRSPGTRATRSKTGAAGSPRPASSSPTRTSSRGSARPRDRRGRVSGCRPSSSTSIPCATSRSCRSRGCRPPRSPSPPA